jgi:hypothetical protein
MKMGLPSAAALRRADHTLVSQSISRYRDSPGCGLIILSSVPNSESPIDGEASTDGIAAKPHDTTTLRATIVLLILSDLDAPEILSVADAHRRR